MQLSYRWLNQRFKKHRLGKIRRYLDRSSTEILICAFVSSKLDHCNSILYEPPVYKLNRLQLLQNTAARIVTLTRKFDHISPAPYTVFIGCR